MWRTKKVINPPFFSIENTPKQNLPSPCFLEARHDCVAAATSPALETFRTSCVYVIVFDLARRDGSYPPGGLFRSPSPAFCPLIKKAGDSALKSGAKRSPWLSSVPPHQPRRMPQPVPEELRNDTIRATAKIINNVGFFLVFFTFPTHLFRSPLTLELRLLRLASPLKIQPERDF